MRIEDYALIGDCQTAALVGRDGSIDWLCWPRFDSPACFAALLGSREHGRWRIAPADPHPRVRRRYREDTLILETEFECGDGAVTVTDFMPVREWESDLVRIVTGTRGRMAMELDLVLRFDYGSAVPWVTRLPDNRGIRAVAGPDMAVLRSPVPLHGEALATRARFEVRAGDKLAFVLACSPSHLPVPQPIEPSEALAGTEAFWREWSERCEVAGEWSQAVRRSLVTLKALTYAPTGGIVAAPTTSLPEELGGVRNWDYRFCWLRDATLTLLALMNGGHRDEASAWREWLVRAVAGSPAQMQIMYGIAGERRLPESELGWLPGYEGARPVRIGNAAADHLQLDVFGEVMDALHQACKSGLASDEATWNVQRALLEYLETAWERPDRGIWEVRGPPRHFTHSKVMCWVAFDRGVKAIEQFGRKGPVERWRALRERIHADVCRNGYSERARSFVQSYGSEALDASLLLIPITGFLPAADARVRSTVEAVRRHLTAGGFVLRYRTEQADDGLPPGEGAFLACSFWLVDNLCMEGRFAEARELFERLLALRNDVGLLAEEFDPRSGRQVGNFPQAFSHVALVNAAMGLSRHAPKPAEQRAEA
ncbi:MAG TPA: glycoside hydrolase family 15 protein [Burkholderiales bacterium]|nr:glycoside hydrolase family 15 protein [Burkholderiales bacterium]